MPERTLEDELNAPPLLHPAHYPVEQQVWRHDEVTGFDHEPVVVIVCGCNPDLALPVGHEGVAET